MQTFDFEDDFRWKWFIVVQVRSHQHGVIADAHAEFDIALGVKPKVPTVTVCRTPERLSGLFKLTLHRAATEAVDLLPAAGSWGHSPKSLSAFRHRIPDN